MKDAGTRLAEIANLIENFSVKDQVVLGKVMMQQSLINEIYELATFQPKKREDYDRRSEIS